MPVGTERRPRGPLAEALAFYRDLGVTDVYLSESVPAGAPVSAPEARPVPAPAPLSGPAAVVPALGAAPVDPRAGLAELAATVAACRRCTLCETRKRTVFSDGSAAARLMFVGEAPGADEDAQGVPFVGRAGQLLTKMIEAGMGLARQDVYIANVLKCRPPDNRNPEPAEIRECRGYLEAQIEAVKPAVIVALGKFAAQFLLDVDEGIMRTRGRWGDYRGIPVMPTYHPSFLLRAPERKKEAWEDLLKVLAKLGLPAPRKS